MVYFKTGKCFVGIWGLETRHGTGSHNELMHDLHLKHKAKGPELEFSIQSQTSGPCVCLVMKVRFLRRIIYLTLYSQ